MTKKALDGIRVLDLTNVLSGPFATLHLALLGAEVIKIENPLDGDLARKLGNVPKLNKELMGTSFLAQNANKKSITLNLKKKEAREVFLKLVATADVVVENFRPGVVARLGVGWEAMRAVNPRLVYCAISGFGQDGPDADKPAYDQIIQGLSGTMAVNGDERLSPLRGGVPVCDTVGGLTTMAERLRFFCGANVARELAMAEPPGPIVAADAGWPRRDRKSTRLNSSHET